MEMRNEELFPLMYKFWGKQAEVEHSLDLSSNDFQNKVDNDDIDLYEEEKRIEDLENPLEEFSVENEDTARVATYEEKEEPSVRVLDGNDVNDIPARYLVPTLQPYEFPAVGVWIDRRIVPGFKYRVRPIDTEEFKDEYLFNGNGLTLQNIGNGYSRRIVFAPSSGQLNNNPNYFWSDSRTWGFAFQLQLVSVGEKYTVYDISNHPVGHLEIVQLQSPQEELSHAVLDDRSVEKSARVHCLAKMEWFDSNEICVVSICGTAVSIKRKNSLAKVNKITGVMISGHPRRNYTLYPGVDNKKRCITVSGASCNDVPINYSLVGLENYELPVIGTYVDSRILPGFCYKVRPINSKHHLFDDRALRLLSIGNGYSKRLTFAPDEKSLNSNQNYFWTDSWPSGFGFELRAVHCNAKFKIYADDRCVGFASVFRADSPQCEEKQVLVRGEDGVTVVKYVHVDITCHVVLRISENENDVTNAEQVMRVSGTAMLKKSSRDKIARLDRIENIGLDSQLNVLFFAEHSNLIFYAA
ncbi:uncharacterized protein LOC135831590 isoform X2 [Planococcus citri]|uniref:uncharacterized protein LOC135831590 isoform X2 n=1 Tax=Planococcus citri TaxID=170843 RepID=UPI0031F8B53A